MNTIDYITEKMYEIPKKYQDSSLIFFKNKWISKIKINQKKFRGVKTIVEDWNSIYEEVNYKVPESIGKELENLFASDDYLLGIHRTPLTVEMVEADIYSQGLRNRSREYSSTVQTFKHFPSILREILLCNYFKGANGCILVCLPKNQQLPIYKKEGDKLYILPEYIYGYVEVEDEKIVGMSHNPFYLEKHEYDPTGLFYDEDLKRKTK